MAADHLPQGPTVDDTSKKVLKTANPPWHSVAFVATFIFIFGRQLPSLQELDEIATIDTFTNVLFANILTIHQIAVIRLVIGAIIMIDTLHAVFFGKWEQDTDYFDESKLVIVRNIPFRGLCLPDGNLKTGLMTLSSFTMWNWTLQGIYFITAGTIPFLARPISPWTLRVAIVCWEISAPLSLLVSAIVKYILWPQSLLLGSGNSAVFRHPGALLEHNLNSVSVLLEVGVMGGVPCRYSDFALAAMFGLVYVLFTWSMMHSWCDQRLGPQFIYPFFDTTLGIVTTISLVALLAVLVISQLVFTCAEHVLLDYIENDALTHVSMVVVLSAAVCRFRD